MKSFFLIVVTALLSGVVSFLVSSANIPTSSISGLVFGEKINPQDNMPHVSLSLATSDGRNLKTSFEKTSTLVSVRDYALQHMVGGASDFTLDRQVKAGANSVFVIENSLIHQGEHVVGENIPQDTVVTSIESSHPASKDFTLSKTTLMTVDENPYAPSNGGMSTLLVVNENVLVPVGADVAGIGIPAHTHVIKTDGNRIYIDNDVTQTLTSGANIKISWKSMKVSLSGSVSSDINVGAFIGFYTQDDADVFQRAVNAMNDGKGGNVYVPGGVYYLGHMVVTRPRSSFVVASSVQFIHGSASIDSDNGG